MLLDLDFVAVEQREFLFEAADVTQDQSALMEVLDQINGRWGKATVHVGMHRRCSAKRLRLEDETGAPDPTLHHGAGGSASCACVELRHSALKSQPSSKARIPQAVRIVGRRHRGPQLLTVPMF
jgi:hypothetical protein